MSRTHTCRAKSQKKKKLSLNSQKYEEEEGEGWRKNLRGERVGGWVQRKQCWVVPVAPRLPTNQHQPLVLDHWSNGKLANKNLSKLWIDLLVDQSHVYSCANQSDSKLADQIIIVQNYPQINQISNGKRASLNKLMSILARRT